MVNIKDYTFPISVIDIQDILPHRYPFLLVDKVIEMKDEEYIIGQK